MTLIVELEIINNIESILPKYELDTNTLIEKKDIFDKNISLNNIEIKEPANFEKLADDLDEDDEDMQDNDIENQDSTELDDLDVIEAIEGKEQLLIHIKKEIRNS